ncbi:MAG: PHP domain-containing protein [Kiritimatiellales bacterium]|nr:PHP domain-containing protein [Kiritimatiellales bacterium]
MIDLHTHSYYSDGTDSPDELVALAKLGGLRAVALTDHDSVGGIAEFLAAGENSALETVPGIELSAECESGTMHILGYYFDYTCSTLLEKLERVRQGREDRNYEILKRLNKLGFTMMWSDVEQQAGEDVVGRPHFAAALVERGHVKSKKDAFDMLLAKGRPAYVERYRYSPTACVQLIRQAGGVPVLAHPATVNLPDSGLKDLIRQLQEDGLEGIEAYYSEYRPENIEKYRQWALEMGLIATGGTDYHGRVTPDIKVGRGFGGLAVPDEALEQLQRAHQSVLGSA